MFLVACGTDGVLTPPRRVSPAGSEPSVLGLIEGVIDETGHVTFTPVSPVGSRRMLPGVSAAVYGTQNVNVRVYSSRTIIDSTATTKTWRMPIGIRNLLPYPVGATQAGASPSDTLGVFVALVGGPTVTMTSGSCPPSCSVVAQEYDGVASFTAPNQPYYYWHERLAAVQDYRKPSTGLSDTVSTRRPLVFTGPLAVKSFSFAIIVSAAWPPAAETFWSTFYNAATDSEPDLRASPPWKALSASGGSESWPMANGALGLNGNGGSARMYLYRSDSLDASSQAYIEAQLELNGKPKPADAPRAVLGLSDGTRFVGVGISQSTVGFVSYTFSWRTWQFAWDFVGTPYTFPRRTPDGTSVHTYRVRKFGADSATLELDGVRVAMITGAQFPARPFIIPAAVRELFGAGDQSGTTKTAWSYVTYGIGRTQP